VSDVEPTIVVAGHICLDVHVEFGGQKRDFADLLAPGKLIEVGPARFTTGGPVANTGLTLHRLGSRVRLVGKVGADVLGRATLDVLRSHGADLADEMIVSADDHSSYTIVVSPPGTDRCFLHYPGANHTFRAADVRDEQLAGAAWLHFGYPPLMRSICERDGAELVAIFERAHAAGLVTSLDMAVPDPNAPSGQVDWPRWLANVLPHVDVFLPSLDETLFMLDRERFKTFSGAKDQPIEDFLLREVAGRLLDMGTTIVGLKLGDAGFYVKKRGHSTFLDPIRRDPKDAQKSRMSPFLEWADCEVRTPCFEVEVCGTTGAGDATIAGFIAAMLKGLAPQEAAKMAVAVGAYSVEAPDASSGVSSWQTVVKRVQSGWPLRSA
jgi:sugar/nucleoside kinase (ribokinase family)